MPRCRVVAILIRVVTVSPLENVSSRSLERSEEIIQADLSRKNIH